MSQVYLVGIDCSDCCNRALDYAVSEATAEGAEVIVAHVIEWSPFTFSTADENEQRHKRREAELARAHSEILDPVVERLKEQGVKVRGVIRHGHIARTLKSLGDEVGATTIVVGRRGDSGFKSHLFGSVPGSLIQIAKVPVTVVP